MSLKNKIKRKKREQESIINRRKHLVLEKWKKEYYTSEYPVTKPTKRLTWSEFKKFVKKSKS